MTLFTGLTIPTVLKRSHIMYQSWAPAYNNALITTLLQQRSYSNALITTLLQQRSYSTILELHLIAPYYRPLQHSSTPPHTLSNSNIEFILTLRLTMPRLNIQDVRRSSPDAPLPFPDAPLPSTDAPLPFIDSPLPLPEAPLLVQNAPIPLTDAR